MLTLGSQKDGRDENMDSEVAHSRKSVRSEEARRKKERKKERKRAKERQGTRTRGGEKRGTEGSRMRMRGRGGRERGLEGIYRGREDAGDGSMLIAISRRGDGSLLPQRPHPCSGR